MKNEKVDTFNNRLKFAMSHRNIKAIELADKTGLSKAQISQYTNNVYEAKQKALYLLAQALNVNETWLMGYDVEMEKNIMVKENELTTEEKLEDLKNLLETESFSKEDIMEVMSKAMEVYKKKD